MVGKNGPDFPMVGNFFSNGWKTCRVPGWLELESMRGSVATAVPFRQARFVAGGYLHFFKQPPESRQDYSGGYATVFK
jgi:hypothetical protein